MDSGGAGGEQTCGRPRQRLERRLQAALGQDRGVDAVGELVGDRCRHQLGERGQARLGVRRQLLQGRADTHQAPEAALDGDRHPDRPADACLADNGTEWVGDIGIAAQPPQ
jgi:hypothetical protein